MACPCTLVITARVFHGTAGVPRRRDATFVLYGWRFSPVNDQKVSFPCSCLPSVSASREGHRHGGRSISLLLRPQHQASRRGEPPSLKRRDGTRTMTGHGALADVFLASAYPAAMDHEP